MKRFIYCLFLLAVMASCSDGTVDEFSKDLRPEAGTATYSYEGLVGSDYWKTLTTAAERFEACQIPADILPKLSTENLVELCATYPLNFEFMAFDYPIESITNMEERFNGFIELKKCKDSMEKLLALYEGFDFSRYSTTPYPITIHNSNGRDYTIIQAVFIEHVLSTDYCKSLYKTDLAKIGEISRRKFEQKLPLRESEGLYVHDFMLGTLRIMARVALAGNDLSAAERETLTDFLNSRIRWGDGDYLISILYR